ncbi:MAG TPA: hypothetical protein VGJ91_11740 [Polyangiaceae bacterium]|jgi:hypothetical protein
MNTRETALIGLIAAVFSIVCCQILLQVAGHHRVLHDTQVAAGLTICLVGVAVGVLIVLCVSSFQEARSFWDRSLGALGLVLGCALLLALVGRHAPRTESASRAMQEPGSAHWVAAARGALLLAPGTSR